MTLVPERGGYEEQFGPAAAGPKQTSGLGAPTADDPVASLYMRRDGGAGTSLYVREPLGWMPAGSYGATGVSITSFGAVGDAVANDRAAIQACVSAVASRGGGDVVVPRVAPLSFDVGSPITVPSNVRLVGEGKGASVIRKTFNGPLFDFSGAGHVSRCTHGGMRDLELNGNSTTTGVLVKADYCDHMNFDRVYFNLNNDTGFSAQELWDTSFSECEWEWCSGPLATQKSVVLSNSATDSTNAIWFSGCRWESFKGGSLNLVGNGFNLHSIYLVNCKMETTVAHDAAFIDMTGDCRNIHVKNLYAALVSLDSGVASVTMLLHWIPYAGSSLRDVTAYVNSAGLYVPISVGIGTGGAHAFENITCDNDQTPSSGGIINFETACDWMHVRNVRWRNPATTGAVLVGSPGRKLLGDYLPHNAGAINDAFFPSVPANGTQGIDETNHRLYVRENGSWKYAALT